MGQVTPKGRLAITGANGFIGQHAVAAARAAGLPVLAIVRRQNATPDGWARDPGILVSVADLAKPEDCATLANALADVFAVVHAAASLAGDDTAQARDTVAATGGVFAAIEQVSGARPRVVLLSSLSVYGLSAAKQDTEITEKTRLEGQPKSRDAYCRAKLAQEALATRRAGELRLPLVILRPGAVFGAGRLWNGHIGVRLGGLLLALGRGGQVPVCSAQTCAAAMVLAASCDIGAGDVEVFNLVDDDLPTRDGFIAALRQTGWPRFVLHLDWRVFYLVGWLLAAIPGLSDRLPGLLRPAVLRARMMPVRYSNARAKTRLGWRPAADFDQAFLATKEAA